jgi:hypothetical protein
MRKRHDNIWFGKSALFKVIIKHNYDSLPVFHLFPVIEKVVLGRLIKVPAELPANGSGE